MAHVRMPEPLVLELRARYAEPHRRYHDVRHLEAVLDHVDLLADLAGDPVAVRYAAWFHDAVYDPRAADNEERSAALAEHLLPGYGASDDLVAAVARLVRLTATHDPEPGDADGEVLCDADLAVLGGDPRSYADYVLGVRQEYAHVPDAAFAEGRAAVLRRLLERPRIYRTEAGYRTWEAAARANLAAELSAIAPSGGAAPPPAAG